MTKRSQMRKRFGRRNFKPRWFRLTSQSLSYAKTRGKRTICDIPLADIVQVERLSDEDSFKMQNVFQVSGASCGFCVCDCVDLVVVSITLYDMQLCGVHFAVCGSHGSQSEC